MSLLNIPVKTAFTILIDSMEKHPFSFQNLTTDSNKAYRPLEVQHRWQALGPACGDYSLENHQPNSDRNPYGSPRVAIERKSPEDLIGTILSFKERRPRFENELANLATLESAAVIVEGTISAVLDAVEEHGKKSREDNAKTLYRSIIAYQQDYKLPWFFCDDRRLAEITAFRFLERFHRKFVVSAK